MSKDAFIVKCEKEDYDVLYLPSSFQIAKIEKGSDVEKMQIPECELMEKEERKLRLGEGKVGITFMSARTCNLRCKYCYAGEGEYGNVSDKPKILSADMYMKAVKMVLREYSEGIKSISFFGGEPLIGFKEISLFVPELISYFEQNKLEIPKLSIITPLYNF